MRIKLFTKRTTRFGKKHASHDHVCLLDENGSGKTLGSKQNHIHRIEKNKILKENGHVHYMAKKKKKFYKK